MHRWNVPARGCKGKGKGVGQCNGGRRGEGVRFYRPAGMGFWYDRWGVLYDACGAWCGDERERGFACCLLLLLLLVCGTEPIERVKARARHGWLSAEAVSRGRGDLAIAIAIASATNKGRQLSDSEHNPVLRTPPPPLLLLLLQRTDGCMQQQHAPRKAWMAKQRTGGSSFS